MLKILTVIGARPQFIKTAMLSKALSNRCIEIVLHTGQHYSESLSEIFWNELGLPPIDINLNVGSGSHADQTGKMMVGIEKAIEQHRPNLVLVYGDTNSTLAGAVTAAKASLPLAHVEAGMRSFNRSMPEEINRIVCDQLSTLLFCPSNQAAHHLKNEGITQGVSVVGDILADAVRVFQPIAFEKSWILQKNKLAPRAYVLATIHRAGNTDNPEKLKSILAALALLDVPVILPLHPRTQAVLKRTELPMGENIHIIQPVGYLDMLMLESQAATILTDSGGIQKEAYWAGVRCITLREETEWTETVQAGWNYLAGSDTQSILDAYFHWFPPKDRPILYGDGHTAEKIADILLA